MQSLSYLASSDYYQHPRANVRFSFILFIEEKNGPKLKKNYFMLYFDKFLSNFVFEISISFYQKMRKRRIQRPEMKAMCVEYDNNSYTRREITGAMHMEFTKSYTYVK